MTLKIVLGGLKNSVVGSEAKIQNAGQRKVLVHKTHAYQFIGMQLN